MNTVIPGLLETLFAIVIALDVRLTLEGVKRGIKELSTLVGPTPKPATVVLFGGGLVAAHAFAVFMMVKEGAPLVFSAVIIGASIAWRGRAVLHNRRVLKSAK